MLLLHQSWLSILGSDARVVGCERDSGINGRLRQVGRDANLGKSFQRKTWLRRRRFREVDDNANVENLHLRRPVNLVFSTRASELASQRASASSCRHFGLYVSSAPPVTGQGIWATVVLVVVVVRPVLLSVVVVVVVTIAVQVAVVVVVECFLLTTP